MGEKQALRDRLAEIGQRDDADFPLAEAALVSAALDRPEIDLSPYIEHLMSLGAEVQTVEALAAQDRAQRLSDLLFGHYGYVGDEETYDDPSNSDLIDVIDRRKGLPVAIAIIYLQAVRDAGWVACGLDFPGHFIIRVDGESDRAILDPFHGGKLIAAQELRELLKVYVGP
ncbi:MAG: transglutaminase-like domain-containing protein, partial [Alphaproteobacteria bacterium]|nr:transglutaminase-like domain-containing protein [Alphaproteobacteria bacterium]